jgi:hypothetical protein
VAEGGKCGEDDVGGARWRGGHVCGGREVLDDVWLEGMEGINERIGFLAFVFEYFDD